jgi:PTS system fructose-specific IIC component
MDDKVRESLLHANSPEEVLQIIPVGHAVTANTYGSLASVVFAEPLVAPAAAASCSCAGATSGSANTTDANEPYVLAVTACPTGIAHTYMARDALKVST